MRKIASVILLVTFIILSVSGVQLATVPKPQAVQRPAGIPNTDKSTAKREMPFYPKQAHEVAGYLFIGAGASICSSIEMPCYRICESRKIHSQQFRQITPWT